MTTQTFTYSAPAVFVAALGLIQTAAAAYGANPPLWVVPFDLGSYVPNSYILLKEITKIKMTPRATDYSFIESYDLNGRVIVFTGDSPFGPDQATSSVTTDALTAAWDIFQTCVMSPLISNRNQPILGASPSPYKMEIDDPTPASGQGRNKAGEPWGWESYIDWSVHFEAYIAPQSA